MSDNTPRWVISLSCPDRPGIVHALTTAIVVTGGNITELQQFSSDDTGVFFARIEVEADATEEQWCRTLNPICDNLGAQWSLDLVDRPLRTLVLCSTAAHVVNDLLFRHHCGQLPIDIPLVMSNHDVLAPLAKFYGIDFESHVVVPDTKQDFEQHVMQVVDELDIELVVLARYMQILSPQLCDHLAGKIINIHHSFLPGFKGANPYRQAHARGVKLIGATAHFVTSDLDEGPIIEQNVVRVDHTRSPKQLMAIGQDQESKTLSEAVKLFSEHRVLLDGIRTIVFH